MMATTSLQNPHAPLHAAALAVRELALEMIYDDAWWIGHKGTAWVRPDPWRVACSRHGMKLAPKEKRARSL